MLRVGNAGELLPLNVFEQFIREVRNDPVRFVKEYLGEDPDPWQSEVLEEICNGSRLVSCKSGHGVGKSTLASWASIHFLLTRYPCKCILTSPTSSQLFDALYSEVKRWIKVLPDELQSLLTVKSDRVELTASPSDAFLSCRTSRLENPESLQGVHSEHVLLIADEASAIPEVVFNSAISSMSSQSATTVLLGNPTRNTGFFFDTHHKLKDRWYTKTISCVDSSRVSKDFIEEVLARSGDHSNEYRVRVLGEFPLTEDQTVISYELVKTAQDREVTVTPETPFVWGVDVARHGSDWSVLCKRQGSVVRELIRWKNLDTMALAGAIKAEFDSTHYTERPHTINIDSIGIGQGVCDAGFNMELPIYSVNVSESASLKQHYLNLRAELYFKIKDWLETRKVKLPYHEKLVEELLAIRYTYTPTGKIKIESKDDLKKRLLKSPDHADALSLTFANDIMLGQGGTSSIYKWNKPIRRNLQGVA